MKPKHFVFDAVVDRSLIEQQYPQGNFAIRDNWVEVYLERAVPDEDGKFTNVMLVSFERIALTHLLSQQR